MTPQSCVVLLDLGIRIDQFFLAFTKVINLEDSSSSFSSLVVSIEASLLLFCGLVVGNLGVVDKALASAYKSSSSSFSNGDGFVPIS